MLFNILNLMFFTMILSVSLTVFTKILIMKQSSNQEKNSPFECGFNPKNSPRMSFSSQFFSVALIFLIFKVEIALLLPIPMSTLSSNMMMFILTSSSLILILILGLLYEWNIGALAWMKY